MRGYPEAFLRWMLAVFFMDTDSIRYPNYASIKKQVLLGHGSSSSVLAILLPGIMTKRVAIYPHAQPYRI